MKKSNRLTVTRRNGLLCTMVSLMSLSCLTAEARTIPFALEGDPTKGGPPGVRILDIAGINANGKITSDNTRRTDDSVNSGTDGNTSLARRAEEKGKDNAMYAAEQARKLFSVQAGMEALKEFGPPAGNETYRSLALIDGGAAQVGAVGREARGAVAKTHADADWVRFGAGGTAQEMVKVINALNESGAQDQDTCQRMSGSHYSGCQSGELGGLANNLEVGSTSPKGLTMDKGQPGLKATMGLAAVFAAHAHAEVKQAALGLKNVREVLIAEKMIAEGNRKGLAKYDLDLDEAKKLMILVDGRTGGEDAVRAIHGQILQYSGGNGFGAAMKCLGDNMGVPNRRGKDDYKAMEKASQQATSRPPCRNGNDFPSKSCADMMKEGAIQNKADKGGNEKRSAKERMAGLNSDVTNMGLQAISRAASECKDGQAAAALNNAMEHIAAITMTPEYMQYYASLDDKKAKELQAEAHQFLENMQTQFALNMRDQRFKDENVMFAMETEDTKLKQTSLASLMRDSGVDIANLTPIMGGNKYAALIPVKDDALHTEPTIMQARIYNDADGLLKFVSTGSIIAPPATSAEQ